MEDFGLTPKPTHEVSVNVHRLGGRRLTLQVLVLMEILSEPLTKGVAGGLRCPVYRIVRDLYGVGKHPDAK